MAASAMTVWPVAKEPTIFTRDSGNDILVLEEYGLVAESASRFLGGTGFDTLHVIADKAEILTNPFSRINRHRPRPHRDRP